MKRTAIGIDIGGTRTKLGLVDLDTGAVSGLQVFNTVKESEEGFLQSVAQICRRVLDGQGFAGGDLSGAGIQGAGVSIGSYVFADGSIDGMSSFVPFMTQGYPLVQRMERALGLPVRAGNDARLIGLAESRYGAGKDYNRMMSLTLGTGIGVGLCEGGQAVGDEAFFHLAGHIKVRTGGEYPCLDSDPCYCGIEGCFESTCSGTALERYQRETLNTEGSNRVFFDRAKCGDTRAASVLEWYLGYLAEALNQYAYLYAPDVIVLGGGLAKGLAPWESEIERRVTARVHHRHAPEVRISTLMENAGVLGAALLFLPIDV